MVYEVLIDKPVIEEYSLARLSYTAADTRDADLLSTKAILTMLTAAEQQTAMN